MFCNKHVLLLEALFNVKFQTISIPVTSKEGICYMNPPSPYALQGIPIDLLNLHALFSQFRLHDFLQGICPCCLFINHAHICTWMQMHRTTIERDSSMGYHMWFERENNTNKLERCQFHHNTLCLSPKFCISYCFQMLLGGLHIPQKNVKTMFYTNLKDKHGTYCGTS